MRWTVTCSANEYYFSQIWNSQASNSIASVGGEMDVGKVSSSIKQAMLHWMLVSTLHAL